MAQYNIDRDFDNFSAGDTLASLQKNEDNLIRLGLIEEKYALVEDDKIFNEPFVYCGSHHRVHSTGWCTVNVCNKRPLRGDDIDSAIDHAFKLGLISVKH